MEARRLRRHAKRGEARGDLLCARCNTKLPLGGRIDKFEANAVTKIEAREMIKHA